jgi:hypothetical protein
MSKDHFRNNFWPLGRIAWLVLAASLSVPAAYGETSLQSQSKMKSVEPRKIVRTVESIYSIFQGEKTAGSEKVTRDDYNDNSVRFRSEIELQFQQDATTILISDMVLEEETFFPISFEMTKKILREDLDVTLATHIEWYSNVAVIHKTTPGGADTSRVILPAGVAVIDINVAHHLFVPLYWYDTDAAGVQSFNVVDPWTTKTISATLRLQTQEMIEVNGSKIETERYEFVRAPQTFKVYVDAKGRIVKLDQGFFMYELSEWSETVGQAE